MLDPRRMVTDEKINAVARIAREGEEPAVRSILTLAAASYGSRPTDESTVPTGFDARAAALFECIVEGAYLVATADGVFDEEERRTFERVVTSACAGSVLQRHVSDLVADLADQLAEDGLDQRINRLAEALKRPEHAREVLRIAGLIAQASEDVSDVERSVMEKLAKASGLGENAVDEALADVASAIAEAMKT